MRLCRLRHSGCPSKFVAPRVKVKVAPHAYGVTRIAVPKATERFLEIVKVIGGDARV
jgi:hypothetical protein